MFALELDPHLGRRVTVEIEGDEGVAAGLGDSDLVRGREGVGGVRAGADDYIVKPFEPREVLARLRAVLRRVPPQPAPVASAGPIRLGRCWFDPTANHLTRAADGAEVPLTAGEGELLRALARHPGLTLTRARLAELTCGEERGGRGVDSHIVRPRRKLEADPARPAILVTRPGSGYALLPGEG